MRSRLPTSAPPTVRTSFRALGAIAIFAVGADHIEQYWVDDYRVVPTIGTLFLLLFLGSMLVGAVLLAPLHRLSPRAAHTSWLLAALSGAGIAGGALAGLIVSEHTPLFGFMEHGYRTAIVFSIVAEVAAMLLLGAFVTTSLSARHERTMAAIGPAGSRPGAAEA